MSKIFTTPSRSRALSEQILTHAAYSVLDNDIGKLLNYGQLRNDTNYKEPWNTYFSNEIGGLCQGVGKGENGVGKRVEGTNTFHVIFLKTFQRTV